MGLELAFNVDVQLTLEPAHVALIDKSRIVRVEVPVQKQFLYRFEAFRAFEVNVQVVLEEALEILAATVAFDALKDGAVFFGQIGGRSGSLLFVVKPPKVRLHN